MTNRIPCSRHDRFVAFWAIAPAIAVPWLFLAWQHHIEAAKSHIAALDVTYSPVPAWMIVALFAVMAIGVTSLTVVIGDVNRRGLSDLQRRMWKTLTLIGYPFGGAIYWMVNCRGARLGSHAPNNS